MAEKEFKYDLEFRSTATGTGARETVEALQQVERSTAALTSRQADLKAEFSTLSDRFDATRTAYYDLGAEIDRTRRKQEKLPDENRKVTVSSRNTSMALLELSRGFEDAQYGIRGVLNNIPSLVLSLGGTAGLAGGISIAAVALSQIIPLFSQTSEKAGEANDKIGELAEKMGQIQSDKLDAARDAINQAAEESAQLRQDWNETTKADNEYKAANLTNAEAIRAAGVKINEMLGIRVDKIRELAAAEAAETEKRRLATETQLNAETKRLTDAVANEGIQGNKLAKLETQNEKDRENLRIKLEQLGVLKAQKAELEAMAALPTSTMQSTGAGMVPVETPNADAIRDARNQLANPSGRIQMLENEIQAIREQLKSDDKAIRQAEVSLQNLTNTRLDIEQAVTIKSEQIVQDFQAADLTGKVSSAAERTKAIIAGVEEGFLSIQTQNELGKAIVERTKSAFSDGVVTAKEQEQLSRDMVTLIGLMQSGQASNRQSVNQMISIQKSTNAELDRINGELAKLWNYQKP